MGPKISAEKSNKNKSPGQILKNRFMKNLRGSLVKAALVIKKPDIAKNTLTAKNPTAVLSPNEKIKGSSPNLAI
jgi:hypothetical protein